MQKNANVSLVGSSAIPDAQMKLADATHHATMQQNYREPLKNASQVVWNWVKKLCFVYHLLQARERNFFTPYSHNLGSIL